MRGRSEDLCTARAVTNHATMTLTRGLTISMTRRNGKLLN
jgi:hypothetical protein